MKEYCFTCKCDQRTVTVRYNSRELTFIVLGKPLLPAAEEFVKAIGLWDNFSVAHGMDTKAWTTKSRSELLKAVRHLEQVVKADRELLQYDYLYGFSTIPNQKNSAARGVGNVGGKGAVISAKSPGQLYLELWEKGPDGKGRIVETRDLRKGPPVETDDLGTIKIYRRRNKVDWEPKLSKLVEFLQASRSESVNIVITILNNKGLTSLLAKSGGLRSWVLQEGQSSSPIRIAAPRAVLPTGLELRMQIRSTPK